ncbi:ATP-binding cassette domain-containing protein [uncultured Ilyobacter sp.]|uniref:ABC transporter ATP-binding protein n=1 Tax=uncultured Ilyobacter sp. TaxID=544433 RepID=UPI002AA66FD9|nr:ATP-binding cassette domain-containing protein [uncultured Ilyobacter sp.]
MIEIRNLVKSFGKRRILDIEKLVIDTLGITAVRGENGLGKTTLFSLISGLEKDFEGEILKKGIDEMDITFVQQNFYLLKRTVYENIAYPLKIRKWNDENIKKRVDFLLSEFRIEHLSEKNASRLSSGESQKVAIARALSFRPKLILLDEPTSNLDKESTFLAESVLSKYTQDEKAGIIMISHDNEQINRMADQTIELKDYIKGVN